MEHKDKVALIFIDTNERIINTREWDALCISITKDGSVLMSYDADELEGGQAESSLTLAELEIIYAKVKAKQE